MSDEDTLRTRARDAMQSGHLPRRRPERLWGGPGNGRDCAVCGHTLVPEDLAFDLEFAGAAGNGATVNHHLHVRCFAAWEFERDNNSMAAPNSATPPANGHLVSLADGASTCDTACLDVRALRAAATSQL